MFVVMVLFFLSEMSQVCYHECVSCVKSTGTGI